MNADESDFQRRLEQAKLDAMKELAYGASHEINNPLANISARAQSLLRDEQDPDRRRMLEAINHQALRAHEMISDLMLFARPPELVYRAVNLQRVIEQAIAESVNVCDVGEIQIETMIDAEMPAVQADESQLVLAVGALIRNAIEALGTSGTIHLASELVDEYAVITVTDDGPGIPPEIREHMFEPFYSGREAGRGLGFGLSKCWRIVKEHSGTVEVLSPNEGGATFKITLPLAPAV